MEDIFLKYKVRDIDSVLSIYIHDSYTEIHNNLLTAIFDNKILLQNNFYFAQTHGSLNVSKSILFDLQKRLKLKAFA